MARFWPHARFRENRKTPGKSTLVGISGCRLKEVLELVKLNLAFSGGAYIAEDYENQEVEISHFHLVNRGNAINFCLLKIG